MLGVGWSDGAAWVWSGCCLGVVWVRARGAGLVWAGCGLERAVCELGVNVGIFCSSLEVLLCVPRQKEKTLELED